MQSLETESSRPRLKSFETETETPKIGSQDTSRDRDQASRLITATHQSRIQCGFFIPNRLLQWFSTKL